MKITFYWIEYYDDLHQVWVPSKAAAGPYGNEEMVAAAVDWWTRNTTSIYRYVKKEYGR